MPLTAPFAASGTATAGTNVSFNFDCGAADSSKLAVIGLHQTGGPGGKLITAITVDGVNCLANVTQGQRHAQVWCALPASSGTVTVNLTYDSAPNNFSWGAWTVLGSSGAPTDTQSTFTGSDASRSLAMTIPSGGIALVSGTKASSPGTPITTTNATEDYDAANTHRYVGAHTTTTGSVSPQFDNVSSMVGFAFAAGGITGGVMATEADDTVSAAGKVALKGAASITEAADTLSANGALAIRGTLSAAEADHAIAATGALPIAGALAATLDETTVAAAGEADGRVGSVNVIEQDDTVAATSVLPITGTLGAPEANDTVLATGVHVLRGEAGIVLADVAVAASADMPVFHPRRGGVDEREELRRRELQWEQDLRRIIDQAWAIAHGLIDPVTLEPVPPPDFDGLAGALALIQRARDQAQVETLIAEEARRQEEDAMAVLLLAA
ncbi:MAG: hypothetical protein AB7F09_20010 [Parvibaculaceae bacterium]